MKDIITASVIAGFFAFAVSPAGAANWNEQMELCASAAQAEGLLSGDDYRLRFLKGGGGATKRIRIEIISGGGDVVVANCRIKRGEVTEVTVS